MTSSSSSGEKLAIYSTVTLSTGYKMPLLGFGVYQNKDATPSVIEAFRAGYRYMLTFSTCSFFEVAEFSLSFRAVRRHVDSAQVYRNEAQVADAVRESGLDRGEVFISIPFPISNQLP